MVNCEVMCSGMTSSMLVLKAYQWGTVYCGLSWDGVVVSMAVVKTVFMGPSGSYVREQRMASAAYTMLGQP